MFDLGTEQITANTILSKEKPEPVFVNVDWAQESIPLAYVAWGAGTTNRVVVSGRQAGNRFVGSLKGLQIRAQFNNIGEALLTLPLTSLMTSQGQGRHLTEPEEQRSCGRWGGSGAQRLIWRVCDEKNGKTHKVKYILASSKSERHTQVPMKRRRPVHCWTVGSTPPLSEREGAGTPEVRPLLLKGQCTVH
jgi:hypothetical protein